MKHGLKNILFLLLVVIGGLITTVVIGFFLYIWTEFLDWDYSIYIVFGIIYVLCCLGTRFQIDRGQTVGWVTVYQKKYPTISSLIPLNHSWWGVMMYGSLLFGMIPFDELRLKKDIEELNEKCPLVIDSYTNYLGSSFSGDSVINTYEWNKNLIQDSIISSAELKKQTINNYCKSKGYKFIKSRKIPLKEVYYYSNEPIIEVRVGIDECE
jgi:hypothetical protein